MSDRVTIIELTKKQQAKLVGLQKKVNEAYAVDEPGAILAQVSPLTGMARCIFCTNKQIKKMYSALRMQTYSQN